MWICNFLPMRTTSSPKARFIYFWLYLLSLYLRTARKASNKRPPPPQLTYPAKLDAKKQFSLSLHLHSYCLHAISADLPEHLLFAYAISTEISCTHFNYIHNLLWDGNSFYPYTNRNSMVPFKRILMGQSLKGHYTNIDFNEVDTRIDLPEM